jgi:branched-chain amino acid transport system permease protein
MGLGPAERRRLGACAAGALVLALAPLAFGSPYRLDQFDYILSLVMVAIGLNVATGFAGQLSLGPSATFAVGGYTAVVLANDHPGVGLAAMAVAAMAAAGVFGLVVGLPALRVGGFYLANVTLFFALLVPIVATNLSVTGRANGISLVANPAFVQSPSGAALYETTLAVVGLLTLGCWALLHSRVGREFVAVRTSEELALALGIPTYRAKLAAFGLSSLPAGLGGAFYAFSQQFVSPGSVSVSLSIYLVAACVIGGLGSVTGPVVGGLLVIGLGQFLGSLAQYEGVIFGVALAAFAVALPQGIVGSGEALRAAVASYVRSAPLGPGRPAPPEARRPAPAPAPARPAGGAGSLVVSGARRSFGGVVAVDGVDLEVARGQLHGLIGSNGSGKTTLLNLVCGFYRLEAGQVRLGEARIDHLPAWRVARAGVARTFQTPQLVAEASVLDNVVPAAERHLRCNAVSSVLRLPPGPRTARAARARALEALELVGLAEAASERVAELPHGTRRVVEVARALALEPGFVLLDEPAAGLGQSEVERLKSVLASMVAAGLGVLLVEHNVPLVLELADRVTVLHQGRAIAQGGPESLRGNQLVAQVFLGRELAGSGDQP